MGAAPTLFQVLQMTDGTTSLRHSHLDPQQLAILPLGRDHEGSGVLVLRIDDLQQLLESMPRGVVLDRGTKNRAKALSEYLTPRGGLIAIRAPYRNSGQAIRGFRALLDAAARYKSRVSCFVGVNNLVFDELAQRANPAAEAPTPSTDTSEHLRALLDDTITVPASLRSAYVGEGAPVEWVRRCIVLAARMDHPVLIQGATGTGKEIVARQIHSLSGRGAGSFFAVNCGGIPAELLESELFGHMKGSFSGANRDKKGFWTLASHGTLFLDEVGDLSLRHQVKILRALEERSYYPIGAEKETHSDARVIAATNRDLAGMVQTGQFREDLYYRLFTFRIRTPTLGEHPADIPQLARYFWASIGDGVTPPLTRAVTDALARCPWPGNARELRAFLINLLFLANGRKVDVPLVHAVLRDRLGPAPATRKDL